MMKTVLACIDGAPETSAVCDLAAWAATRLPAPLVFLNALDRHLERAPVGEHSGAIGLDAQDALLQQLAAVDERRRVLAQQHARPVLDRVAELDGSATGRAMVARVATSPLLHGRACTVVTVGGDTVDSQGLEQARATLEAAGFEADARVLPGEADTAILQGVQAVGAGLLVMGAYGHSRIRQLIAGSTTAMLLRTGPLPVLVVR